MTNTGEGYTNYMAKVPEYGEVWFNEEALINLFGLQDLVRWCRVTFDSQRKNAFIVHIPHGQVKFTEIKKDYMSTNHPENIKSQ